MSLINELRTLAPALTYIAPDWGRPIDVKSYVHNSILRVPVNTVVVNHGELFAGNPAVGGTDLGQFTKAGHKFHFLDPRVGTATEWIAIDRLKNLQKQRLEGQQALVAEYFESALKAAAGPLTTEDEQRLEQYDLIVYHFLFLLYQGSSLDVSQCPKWTAMAVLRKREDKSPAFAVFPRADGSLGDMFPWSEVRLQDTHPIVKVSLGTRTLAPIGYPDFCNLMGSVKQLIGPIPDPFDKNDPYDTKPEPDWVDGEFNPGEETEGMTAVDVITVIAVASGAVVVYCVYKWIVGEFDDCKDTIKKAVEKVLEYGIIVNSDGEVVVPWDDDDSSVPPQELEYEEIPSGSLDSGECIDIFPPDDSVVGELVDRIYLIDLHEDRWWRFAGFWGPYLEEPPFPWQNPEPRKNTAEMAANALLTWPEDML